MKYTLYIGLDCHDCEEVAEALQSRNDVEIINVDKVEVETPAPIFVRPALFEGRELLAYGMDIMNVVK